MSLYEDSGFEDKEHQTHRAIERAIELARNRSQVVDSQGKINCCDFELAAISKSARCIWTRALCDEFEAIVANQESELAIAWFTFVDICGVQTFPRHYGPPLDPTEIVGSFRRGLKGADYVAMMEPAFYTNISKTALPFLPRVSQFRRLICWHCHGLAWSTDVSALKSRFKEIKQRRFYQSFVPGLKGTNVKFIEPDQLGEKIAYMCKTPRSSYRLFCVNPDEFDEDKSEFRQKKSLCRLGDHIHYFSELQHLTLDELGFGGGEGSEMLLRIKKPFLKRVGNVRWRDCAQISRSPFFR